jgi:hypothetical protein
MKRKLLLNLVCIVFAVQTSFAVTKTWVGGAGTDFNTASNWSPSGVPTAVDDVVIAFTNSGTITLSANATINNLTITLTGANNISQLNVLANTLTVKGNSSINITGGNPNTQLQIGVIHLTAAGVIDFVGNVDIGSTSNGDAVFLLGNVNSTVIVRSNFTQGTKFALSAGAEPGTLVFDGTGTQNFTSNDDLFLCRFRDIVIGNTNNPTVNLLVGADPQNDDFFRKLNG